MLEGNEGQNYFNFTGLTIFQVGEINKHKSIPTYLSELIVWLQFFPSYICHPSGKTEEFGGGSRS